MGGSAWRGWVYLLNMWARQNTCESMQVAAGLPSPGMIRRDVMIEHTPTAIFQSTLYIAFPVE